jgi:hypothetical protein
MQVVSDAANGYAARHRQGRLDSVPSGISSSLHTLIELARELHHSRYQQVSLGVIDKQSVERAIMPEKLPFRVEEKSAFAYFVEYRRQMIESIRACR